MPKMQRKSVDNFIFLLVHLLCTNQLLVHMSMLTIDAPIRHDCTDLSHELLTSVHLNYGILYAT